jgi:hypothetical protein
MAARWVSRKDRGRGQGEGGQKGRKEGEGNRFEVLGRLNSEADGDNSVTGDGGEGGSRGERRGDLQGVEGESVEMSESDNGSGMVRGEVTATGRNHSRRGLGVCIWSQG